MSWTLIAQSEALGGQTVTIDRDMVIGRQQQADIVVQAAHVSRRHAALLLKDDGSLWIEDLGSANGTQVNAQPVSGPQQLHDGDMISLQDLQFQIAQTQTRPQTETLIIRASDEGIPTLEQRSQDLTLNRDGMPQHMDIPKPAPIPADAPRITPATDSEIVTNAASHAEHSEPKPDDKQAANVGLMTLMSLIVLAVLAAGYYFMHGL